MNDILTCTLASADERERMLAALHRAGIPDEHITLTPPEAPPGAYRQSAASADFTDWPIADGILCGCIGGAFGAYVGLLSLLIPGLEAVTTLSPSWIIIGSAAFGTAFGGITALIIKAFWPDHEAQLKSGDPGLPTRVLVVHPLDPHEAQVAQEVILGTGHAQDVRIDHTRPA